MLCVVALLVFGVLGIFSASHRRLAREAWDCVWSRVRREPCTTGLDERIEASIVGRLLDISPWLARTVKRHLELLSWIVLIVFMVSGVLAGISVYNYAVYGNCNGPRSDAGCSLEQLGAPTLNDSSDGAKGPDAGPVGNGTVTPTGCDRRLDERGGLL